MNGSTFCPPVYSTDVYRYDPSTDTYTQLTSNSAGTWNQTAVYSNGKIYKMGGENANGYQTALERYDIASDTWSLGAPLSEPTGFAASCTQSGLIIVAGGVVAPGSQQMPFIFMTQRPTYGPPCPTSQTHAGARRPQFMATVLSWLVDWWAASTS